MKKEPICAWSEQGCKEGKNYSIAQYFQYNDGGRTEAGFKGTTGDCGVRAIAIVTELPYKEVYNLVNNYAKLEKTGKRKKRISNARTGLYRKTLDQIMFNLGWEWKATMEIGKGCATHLRADELPEGRILARVSKHYTTIINGVINDIFDPSRQGERCVYGYYYKLN